MRMNKCAYLFAAALVAGTVGMTSCSNEDVAGIENIQGQQTKVSLGLSVKGAGVKAAGTDMNFDGQADIKNIAVVPFVGTAAQKPIPFANITDGANTEIKTVQMVTTVDGFKVYGNLTDDQYEKVNNGVYELSDDDFALTEASNIGGKQCYNPHTQLYYFADAKSFYRATEGENWTGANYGEAKTGAIGSAKYIKIDNVNYAVGVLAAAVMNGDDTKCFYTSEADANGDGTSAMDATTAGVTVSAVLVDGQKDFTVNFTTKDDAKTIYVAADKSGKFSSTKINDTDDAATNGNVFSVVSPTANGEAVDVNIEFNLPQNVFLKTTTGDVIGSTDNATKFYLGLKLTKDAQHTNEVFAKDFVTILNATVKNWGIASKTPVVVTDAQIGVVFDVKWQQGNIYEVEI